MAKLRETLKNAAIIASPFVVIGGTLGVTVNAIVHEVNQEQKPVTEFVTRVLDASGISQTAARMAYYIDGTEKVFQGLQILVEHKNNKPSEPAPGSALVP